MRMQQKKEKHQQIRLLRADEIECRVASVNEKGVSLLLYKDARVDQRILDETYGPLGWKRSHQCINGNLYCTVEVYDPEKKEWVGKQDVGTFGYAEKEKSQASDSFKRACFNWGIGRELYTAPFIWIPASKVELRKKGDGVVCLTRFSVYEISYSADRTITGLRIVDNKGVPVFQYFPVFIKKEEEKEDTAQKKDGESAVKDDKRQNTKQRSQRPSKAQLEKLDQEMKRTGVTLDAVKERYQVKDTSDLTPELYARVMSALKKTQNADAA